MFTSSLPFKRCSSYVLIVILLSLSVDSLSADDNLLPRSTPEAEGISSKAVRSFIEAADSQVNSMHSFMLLRNGKVIAEAWWAPATAETPHVLWSLSKSFTSTAVGLAIEEGKLKLDDPILKFFEEESPVEISDHLSTMRVRDLLSMSAGHDVELDWLNKENWAEAFLRHPVPHKPGTHFRYNTPATYMLSAIVQKVTGETVLDYLTPRLFEPLGIEKPRWDKSPQGVSIGGYGLYLKTEDIAKFGQLYLQKGEWDGKQLVPAKWIEQATSKQISNGDSPNSDWQQGYGFQFWRCRHNAYRGDGKDGQFCLVIPDHNVVVAMTANSDNLQLQLELVWKHLLPAFQEDELADNPDEQAKLMEATKGLRAKR